MGPLERMNVKNFYPVSDQHFLEAAPHNCFQNFLCSARNMDNCRCNRWS